MDGKPVAQIQGGEPEVPRLSPGPHVLEFQSGGAKAILSLDFAAAALPKLTAPIQANGIHAVILSRYGSQAMVYCNTEGIAVILDGKPAGTAGAAGLELKELVPGPHEIRMTINGMTVPISFEASATAGILATLRTERKLVALRINTGENGVAVYLNGQKKATTARGYWQTYVTPKTYTVHIEKPGLWAADQTVEARLGEDAKLTFQLVPAKGTIAIRGAPPGTEVWLDGTQIGAVQDDNFSFSDIVPGTHTISLRKEGFRRVQREYVFEPGKSIAMNGVLESSPGSLVIVVNPAEIEGLQIRIRREGEVEERTVTETPVSVVAGTYRVTGSAPQYQDAVDSVSVAAGRSATATLSMKRLEKTVPQAPPPKTQFTMEDWIRAANSAPSLKGGWTLKDKVWVKQGGEFVLAPINRRPESTPSRRSC